jgi:hypothetical protein
MPVTWRVDQWPDTRVRTLARFLGQEEEPMYDAIIVAAVRQDWPPR